MSVAGFDCGDGSSIAGWVDLGHGGLGEVAAVGDLPFVVDVGQDRADEADDGGFVREDADDAGSRLISLLTRSKGLVDQIFAQCGRGKAVNASTSAFASSISGPILGKPAASWSRTVFQVAEAASGFGWAKIVRNTAATMSLCDFGTNAKRLRAKCTRQR